MIYVMLPSNNRMDIYPNNKISSFKVNFLETEASGSRVLGSITERNSVC